MVSRGKLDEVEKIYHAALERPPDERDAFVTCACAGDDDVAREVRSLLGYADDARRLLDQPVPDAATACIALAPGARLGPYEILGPLGAGGMGEVYRARDAKLRRDVALKVLPDAVARDPERAARFDREARLLASLNHPHILTVFDVGRSGEKAYLVTELVEGRSLREQMRGPAPSIRRALGLALQVARGLAAAHDRGIVHRDVKPENLLVTPDGRVKILDFGIAKALSSEVPEVTETAEVTAPGELAGTLGYMSPEQARGQAVDPRTDVFSLGVVLYELLSGKHPFRRGSPAATLEAILQETPEELNRSAPGIPRGVAAVVGRCLAKDREERYATAHDLVVALEAVLGVPDGSPPPDVGAERSPFPGLDAFTEQDAGIFFGREAAVAALWEKLRQRRLLAVIGASGAGKTSFVRAGVVARRPEGWGALVARPGRSPLMGLGRALAPEVAGDPEAVESLLRFDEPDVVVEAFGRWRRGHREALLVVDQLEELFTLNPPDVQESYATLLARLADEADLHVLLSLRDDFLMRCHEHAPLAPVFESLTPLGGLDRDALRSALLEPARSRGFAFEDAALPDEMVAAVKEERGALPLLAFAAARLWEKRERERQRLTRDAYAEIGGVSGAVARHAEETLQRIGSERQGLVREMFRNLVTSHGTRAACDREELLSVFEDRAAAVVVLRELVDARLLTSYELPAEGEGEPHHRIEVIHESLLAEWPRLVRWRAQDEEGTVLRDQLKQAAHLWDERGRPVDLLWSGTSYRELELWRERYPGGLTAVEEAFVAATVARALRRRRLRRTATFSIVAASLAVAAVVGVLWRRAVSGTLRAEAARVVTLGRLQLDTYPTAALAYARRSLEIADSREARRLAVDALWRGAAARVLPLEFGSWRAAFSPDGSQLAAATFSENVLLVSESGETRLLPGFTQPAGPTFVAFAPSGDRVLARVPPDDDGVRVADLPDGGPPRLVGPTLPDGTTLPIVRQSPLQDGILLVTDPLDSRSVRLRVWPYDGGQPALLGTLRGPVSQLFFGASSVVVDRSGHLTRRPLRGGTHTLEEELGSYDRPDLAFLAMGPRQRQFAIARLDGHLTLMSLPERAGAVRRHFEMEAPEGQCPPAFDHTGSSLAWGSSVRHSASLWDLSGPPDTRPRELQRAEASLFKELLFHPEGDWLASVNQETITFWAVGLPWSRVLAGHTSTVARLQFTPDSRSLLSCADSDGVSVWPLATSTGLGRRQLTSGGGGSGQRCYDMAISPDGREVLWGAVGAILTPLDGSPGRWLLPPVQPVREVFRAAAFAPSGGVIVTASGYTRRPTKKLVRVWDQRLALFREWPQAPAGENDDNFAWSILQLQALPNGQVLAAGNRGVRRLDPTTGEWRWIWRLGASEFARFGASGDGGRLVGITGTERMPPVGPAFLLDAAAGRAPRLLTSHGNRVSAVALDATGQILATGDERGTLRVGRLDAAEPHLLLGHEAMGKVSAVEFSPDGRWIASAAGSEIRLWPMPDLNRPPLHALPLAALIERLRSFTNLEVVEDPGAPGGYRLEVGPFPGWRDVPRW